MLNTYRLSIFFTLNHVISGKLYVSAHVSILYRKCVHLYCILVWNCKLDCSENQKCIYNFAFLCVSDRLLTKTQHQTQYSKFRLNLCVREGQEVARFMGRDVVLIIMVTVVIQVIAGPQGGQGVRPVGLPVVHSSCTQFIQYIQYIQYIFIPVGATSQ